MEGDFFRVRNLNKGLSEQALSLSRHRANMYFPHMFVVRGRAAIASLRKAGPITNAQQAEDLPGIGKKTMQKVGGKDFVPGCALH